MARIVYELKSESGEKITKEANAGNSIYIPPRTKTVKVVSIRGGPPSITEKLGLI